MKVDLHNHSVLSDGIKTYTDRIYQARKLGLDFIAITDHDIVSKEKFIRQAKEKGVETCLWTEITVRDYDISKSLHITAYSEYFSLELYKILEKTRNWRKDKIFSQIKHLRENWFSISRENFISFCWREESLNIFHIANYMFSDWVKEDNIAKISEITWKKLDSLEFLKYFLRDSWEFSKFWCIKVPEYEPSIEQCVKEVINNSNWILSLAHPNFSFEREWLQRFIEKFWSYVDMWINAIEVNTKASKIWVETILNLSKKYNLIVTFWSDSHSSKSQKHWKFWEMNPYIDSELVKEQLKKFKTELWR